MTPADKLRELLATRPAMPNTEQLVSWWRTSAELVPQVLDQLEAWGKAGQAVVATFDPMAHLHRAEPHTMQIVAEAARAAHLSVRADRDRLRERLDIATNLDTRDAEIIELRRELARVKGDLAQRERMEAGHA